MVSKMAYVDLFHVLQVYADEAKAPSKRRLKSTSRPPPLSRELQVSLRIPLTTNLPTRDTQELEAVDPSIASRALAAPSKSTRTTIFFGYVPEADAVTARCSEKVGLPLLLESLFPGDAGDCWPGQTPENAAQWHSHARPFRCENDTSLLVKQLCML
jgi:hypothetical protein